MSDNRLDDIENKIDAIHRAVVGDVQGAPGLLSRVANVETKMDRLESFLRGVMLAVIGAIIAAITSLFR